MVQRTAVESSHGNGNKHVGIHTKGRNGHDWAMGRLLCGEIQDTETLPEFGTGSLGKL